MKDEIFKIFFNNNFKKAKIENIEQESSKREYYRILENGKSYILLDSRKEKKQFLDFLKINNIIKNINVSIPQIHNYDLDNYFMILEDFGKNRYDQIIHKSKYTSDLLKSAINSLIIFKNSIDLNDIKDFPIYDFNFFKNELSEFIDWYVPFVTKKKIDRRLKNIFYDIWKTKYDEIEIDSNSFMHRDFFSNNLFYLPDRKNHLNCGIIDYQGAFKGDAALDIVSLFEDSRRIIQNANKIDMINYYLRETGQKNISDKFFIKLDFIGASRQTRLLGRWIKLMKTNHSNQYLKYINITWYWLEKNLKNNFLCEIRKLYEDLIPINKRKYEN